VMYIMHCVRAFRNVWKDAIGESTELIESVIKPCFLVCAFDELGMINGAPGDDIDDRQSCRRVEVN
jgi:hypothetical protein